MPEQDAVIAITSGVKDMQAVLNLVWDKLLPAMTPDPLATDEESHKKLELAVAGLSIRPQHGSASPAKAANRTFVFPANDRKLEAITLLTDASTKMGTLIAKFVGAEQKIACGNGSWQKGRLALGSFTEQPAAASGAWTADDTYTAKVCFYETPFIVTMSLTFSGDTVPLRVAFEPGVRPHPPGAAAGESGSECKRKPMTPSGQPSAMINRP